MSSTFSVSRGQKVTPLTFQACVSGGVVIFLGGVEPRCLKKFKEGHVTLVNAPFVLKFYNLSE